MVGGVFGRMLIILQGRLLSRRLKYKGLFSFFNQNIFERMIDIAKSVKGPNKIIFASSNKKINLILKKICEKKKIIFFPFKGDEENVFKRFQAIVKKNKKKYKYFLRITCDNYLVQPKIIELLYKKVCAEKTDYGYIDSMSHFSGEIISVKTFLKEGNKKISNKAREHVTWDIRHNKEYSKTILPKNFLNINHLKSPTLDTYEDLRKMYYYQLKYPNLKKIRSLESIKRIFPYRSK